eukprot:310353_1
MAVANRNTKQMVHRFIDNIKKAPLSDTLFDLKALQNAETLISNTICDYYVMPTRSSLMHWLVKQWDDGDNYHYCGIYRSFTRYAAQHLMFEAVDDGIPIVNDYNTIYVKFFSSYPQYEFEYFKSLVQDLNIKIHFKPTTHPNQSISGSYGNTTSFSTLQHYISSVVYNSSH